MARSVVFNQFNLVVRDMETTVAFYRRLGLTIADVDPAWGNHHRSASLDGGLDLDFDIVEFASQWDAGWPGTPAVGMGVLGFSVESREAVNEIYAGGPHRRRLRGPTAALRSILGRPLRDRLRPRRERRRHHEPGRSGEEVGAVSLQLGFGRSGRVYRWHVQDETGWYPRQDSNLCLRLRRPTLYPLSYGGSP